MMLRVARFVLHVARRGANPGLRPGLCCFERPYRAPFITPNALGSAIWCDVLTEKRVSKIHVIWYKSEQVNS